MFYPSTGQAFYRSSLPQTKPSTDQSFYKSSLKLTSVLSLWKGAL